jgi:hypothetical protein
MMSFEKGVASRGSGWSRRIILGLAAVSAMLNPRALVPDVWSVVSAAPIQLAHIAMMQNFVIWHDAKQVQTNSHPYYLYKYLVAILII